MSTVLNIFIMRHGEALGGDHIYRGSSDDELSDKGFKQMQTAAQSLPKKYDAVYSSPLKRCASFASTLSNHCVFDKELAEFHFGDWEGKNHQQIDQQQLSLFCEDPYNNPPPNAENLSDFEARVKKIWLNIIQQNRGKKTNNMIIITHAGVIRCLLQCSLNIDFNSAFHMNIHHACVLHLMVTFDEKQTFVQLHQLTNLT